ncbi:hypothetical protein [Acrocarpospora catenulata]|uniref:hypothetical protein n=1 Tax=Acrocarpospora catenulata TaxID=2836182 RepID=UPI001BDA18D4|nr:hypothetical protein [Acrocarpospora catenulata]
MTIERVRAGSGAGESGWLIAVKVIVCSFLGAAALLITALAYLLDGYVMTYVPTDEVDPDMVVALLVGLGFALFLETVAALVAWRYKVTWLLYAIFVVVAGLRIVQLLPLYQG